MYSGWFMVVCICYFCVYHLFPRDRTACRGKFETVGYYIHYIHIDPVLVGTYITFARLLYIECTPNPFIYFKLSQDEIINKLNIGIKYLNYALEINETDATLHHDLALLLSHEFINKYDKAIYHWLIAYKLDSNNSIYTQQIGYIYQYKSINSWANAASGRTHSGRWLPLK